MRPAKGFTLIEVLVAIGVMAVLALLSWRGIDAMLRTQTHLQQRAAIKHADLIALATERRDLLPNAAQATPWPVLDTPGALVHPLRLSLADSPHPWQHWRDAFLLTFHRLDALRQAAPAPTTAEADA